MTKADTQPCEDVTCRRVEVLSEPSLVAASGRPLWSFQKEFWHFFGAAFFFDAGFSVFFFTFNLFLAQLGYTERTIGLVSGAFSLGSLVGTLPAGELARRWGVRPLLLLCFASASMLGIARALVVEPHMQCVLALLAGLAMGCWGICFLPAVSRLTDETQRGSAFSVIFATSIGTSAVGGLLCSYSAQHLRAGMFGDSSVTLMRTILLAACVVAALGILPAYLLPSLQHGSAVPSDKPAVGSLLHNAALRARELTSPVRCLLLGLALWSGVLACVSAFANVYLARVILVPLPQLALLFSAGQAVQFLAALLMPFLLKKAGRYNAIAATQITAAAMLVIFGAVHTLPSASVVFLSLTAAQWMSSPALYELLMHLAPDVSRSTVASLAMFGNALAGMFATTASGVLLTALGYSKVWPMLGVVALAVALFLRSLSGGEASQHRLLTEPPLRS